MSLTRSIIVLGSDESAWFSAAILAFNCPWLNITVIADGESVNGLYAGFTRGDCERFFGAIGFPWQELLFSASATCKLANRYINSQNNELDFFHGHGSYGDDVGLFEFHQIFNVLKSRGLATNFDAFSLEAQAARNGKFIVSRGSTWALHYDRLDLTRLLRAHAQNLGVKSVDEEVTSIDCGLTGEINKVITESGTTYSADFYINASPTNQIFLRGNSSPDPRFDRRSSVWCLTAYLSERNIYLPVTEFSLLDDQCWIKKIPLQSQTVVELYGRGSPPQPQDVLTRFSDRGLSVKNDSARLIVSSVGRERVFWSGNCVSVGEASASLGNLAFPSLSFTKHQMEKLLKFFPEREQNSRLIDEYNRVVTPAADNILDYHALIVSVLLKDKLSLCELENVSSPLAERIAMFTVTGRYEHRENELIPKDEWISLLMGFGVDIEQQDVLIGTSESENLTEIVESKREEIIKAIDKMPNHLIFLSQLLQSKEKR